MGQPPLITHVETTTAPVADRAVLADVHEALKGKDLLPKRHLVDAGYIDADQLVVSARDHAITLVGPPPADNQWQARTEGAFTLDHFSLDWDNQVATCPAGKTSESWIADLNRDHAVMRIRVFPDPLQGLPAQGSMHAIEPPPSHATPTRGK